MLIAENLTLSRAQRVLCRNLNLTLQAGECWLVLGENGSGKSTLLATLAGWHPPLAGTVRLLGQPLSHWPARQRAQHLAWLQQQDDTAFPLTVLEKALTGRHPHLGPWAWETSDDLNAAQRQLARLDLAALAGQDWASLSGGERRRASLAAVLSQQAQILLLDEALSQLDLRHQQQALAVLAQEAAAGCTVLLVSHDPNHARQFASHVLLLFADGSWRAGTAASLLTTEHLGALYQHPLQHVDTPDGPCFFPLAGAVSPHIGPGTLLQSGNPEPDEDDALA